jgi:hypothetical protein
MRTSSNLFTMLLVGAAAGVAVLRCAIAPAETPQHAQVQIDQNPTLVTVRDGGRLVLDYTTAASPMKPYIKDLCTPHGVQILRDAPHDHLHHHALMFAVAADGIDFWSEKPECGRQVPRSISDAKSHSGPGGTSATFTQVLDWLAPDNAKMLEEQRTITTHLGADIPATLLTWQSRLRTPEGKRLVKLTGSHYFGLGMRFVEAMDKEGKFFNSEGTEGPIVRGSERVTPAKWCAYTSHIDGAPVTVAMFDHPKNAHSAYFFTMRPFAYLAATINLCKEPLDLQQEIPLELRYGVAAWDGEIEPAQVEMLYRKWVSLQP